MYKESIIDCDIHHTWGSVDELLPYMSKGWREYVTGPGKAGYVPLTGGDTYPNPHGFSREDTFSSNGRPPGSDYDTMKSQLLDPQRVEKGILTYGEGLFVDTNSNPYFAAEIARACNDWTEEQWLALDERLLGSILVSNQAPDLAAAEIRRLGANPRQVQVLMANNGLGQPFGHPLFHPIYEAACEFDLPIALHAAAAGGISTSPAGHGTINFYIEYHTLVTQPMMTHIVSMITNGVFEKFPTLKVILIEGGVAWVPSLLWRLDTNYKGLRREVPWLRKLPSEYFREHVRLTTQPLELSPERQDLIDLLTFFDGEDVLLYASDYPHWDSDQVSYVSTRLPSDWQPKIFYQNAKEFYSRF